MEDYIQNLGFNIWTNMLDMPLYLKQQICFYVSYWNSESISPGKAENTVHQLGYQACLQVPID